jgi:DNA (cytosine-5)-methyltransferase 1
MADSSDVRSSEHEHDARERLVVPQDAERGPDDGDAAGRQRQAALESGDGNSWSDFHVIPCRDEKARRISAQPGDGPLVAGIPHKNADPRLGYLVARLVELGHDPKTARRIIREARGNRVGRLKGYGNAIVPHLAAMFVRAFLETEVEANRVGRLRGYGNAIVPQ